MDRNFVLSTTESYRFSSIDTIKYLIDWKKENNIIELVFDENTTTNLLEIDSPKNDITYIVGKNATIHLSISSLNEAFSSSRTFVLNENSVVVVAIADFSNGTKIEKFNFNIEKNGASVNVHLATLASDTDKKEFSVSFTHFAGDTFAKMNNYGVCVANSKLVFSGVGHILKGAKRAKTHQNAKIMVFDPHCHAFANPILKIDENEIEASHAAAVGKVNEEHLFYLTSRGLKEEEAKQLITLGYLKPILGYFDEEISTLIEEAMERRMK